MKGVYKQYQLLYKKCYLKINFQLLNKIVTNCKQNIHKTYKYTPLFNKKHDFMDLYKLNLTLKTEITK